MLAYRAPRSSSSELFFAYSDMISFLGRQLFVGSYGNTGNHAPLIFVFAPLVFELGGILVVYMHLPGQNLAST